MIRGRLGYALAGDGRRPTLRGIARDRSAMVFITLAVLGMAAVLLHLTAERLALRRLSRESTAWARARGVVVDTNLVWSSSPRSGKAYWPTVHYRYSVGGQSFSGDRVAFRPGYGRSQATDAVERYPTGSEVTVWYRPTDPRTSVLEPNTWKGGVLMIVLVPLTVAMTVSTFVCLVLLLFVSQRRR